MTHISWQVYGSEYVYPDGPDLEEEQDRYWRCQCGAFLPREPTRRTEYVLLWDCKRCGKGIEIDETPAPEPTYDVAPF